MPLMHVRWGLGLDLGPGVTYLKSITESGRCGGGFARLLLEPSRLVVKSVKICEGSQTSIARNAADTHLFTVETRGLQAWPGSLMRTIAAYSGVCSSAV